MPPTELPPGSTESAMTTAPGTRHAIPRELEGIPLSALTTARVARFGELQGDWNAFADSQQEGRRRAQYRLIGAGGSGKHDPNAIPAGGFTMSIMCVPPGQGGSAHTHEVEEAFFVLEGVLTVFFEDTHGARAATEIGKWEVVSCPAGIMHGFVNEGPVDVYMQTIIGTGTPGPVGYADDSTYAEEVRRLKERAGAGREP
jgi:mannose-6-phosphate isomerase-like protein (cupin superfamily)